MNENENAAQMPYYVHEWEMVRMEAVNRRWFISFLVVLAMLFATNAGWIIYESQYRDVIITQEADADGNGNNYLNSMGEMTYGQGQTDD